MRQKFFLYGSIALFISLAAYYFFNVGLTLSIIIVLLLIVGLTNSIQEKHAILRNFPVLGYFRYLFEMIAPEIQQYFIERSTDGKPTFISLSKSQKHRLHLSFRDTITT
jgi:hypothetical protein